MSKTKSNKHVPMQMHNKSPRWCFKCGEALTPDEIKDGFCEKCIDEVYWSVWDEDINTPLHAGRNSESKKEAIDGAWQMWADGAQEEFTEEELENIYENVEEWLESIGFVAHPHSEKLPEV